MKQKIFITTFVITILLAPSPAVSGEVGESSTESRGLDAFEEVAKSEEFLRLTRDQLIDIIKDDSLDTPEDKVYEAVMRWMNYQADRAADSPDIFQHVRFSQMEPKYLEEIYKDPLILKFPECKRYVRDAKIYRAIHHPSSKIGKEYDSRREENLKLSSKEVFIEARFRPRRTTYLFAVGGYMKGQSTSSVERFDPKMDKWTEMAGMKRHGTIVGLTALKNILYAVVGDGVSTYSKSIECHNPDTDKWTDNLKSLELARTTYNSIVTLNGILYVTGGRAIGRLTMQSMVKYDPTRNEWVECKPLGRMRSGHAVGALEGYIYILGGMMYGQVSNTVEGYDPELDEWHTVSPMTTKRYDFATAAHSGYLYVAGGIGEDDETLKSAEKYDPHKKIWDLIPSMNEHRRGHGLAVVNGLIHAAGGRDVNYKYLNTVEVYDPEKKTWSKRAPMLKERSFFGLVAVETERLPIG